MILFVQVYQKGGSSSQVVEEAEDVDEGEGVEEVEGAEEGEQQEEEEGILRVSKHLEVMLSLVLLMREK
jgi:hypothetical protein